MDNAIADKVKKTMAAVLEVSAAEITDESSPDTIANWDSVRHMNLVLTLEEEFGIRFDDTAIGEMQNTRLIEIAVTESLAK